MDRLPTRWMLQAIQDGCQPTCLTWDEFQALHHPQEPEQEPEREPGTEPAA